MLFFIFCQMFAIFDDFSKWSSPKMRKFEKSWNIPKWKKVLFDLPSTHFFTELRVPETRILSARCATISADSAISADFTLWIFYSFKKKPDRVPEIGFSGTHNQAEKWVEKQIERSLSSFFAKFLSYLMIFLKWNSMRALSTQSNTEKNEEKPCSTCLTTISPQHLQYPKPGF